MLFEKGDKIRCVKPGNYRLTLGKTYVARSHALNGDGLLTLEDDEGDVKTCYAWRFELAEEPKPLAPKASQGLPETTIESQQAIATDILKECAQRFSGDSMVVGGAPRNWDHGLAAKDIDIYIPCGCDDDKGDLEYKVKRIPGVTRAHIMGAQKDETYEGVGIIYCVVEGEYKGEKVQFIFTSEPYDLITPYLTYVFNSFDCNICKIAYDGEYVRTDEYRMDRDKKRLTFPYWQFDKDSKNRNIDSRHAQKLLKYFPDHDIVIQRKKPKGAQGSPKVLTFDLEANPVGGAFTCSVMASDRKAFPIKEWPITGQRTVETSPDYLDKMPADMRKFIIQCGDVSVSPGEYWKALGAGVTSDMNDAYIYTTSGVGRSAIGNSCKLIWLLDEK